MSPPHNLHLENGTKSQKQPQTLLYEPPFKSKNVHILFYSPETVFFTARKRSLGQGNIFRSVCQEFCPGGRVPEQVTPWDQIHPSEPGTPSGQVHPLGGTAPHPLAGTPLWDQVPSPRQVHPWAQVHPLSRYTPHPSGRCTPFGPGTSPKPGTPHPLGRYTP